MKITIGNSVIGAKNKCFVVAEAGSNHNGDLNIGFKLIDAAKACGCDAVKFQAFRAEDLVSKKADKADYQKGKSSGSSQLEMLKALELSPADHQALIDHARSVKIPLFYSVFDLASVDLIDSLGVEVFKLGSGELTNIPLIKHVAQKNKPVIISTGMSLDAEIADALAALKPISGAGFMLTHCSTGYPSPLKDTNLRRIKYLEDKFKVLCGSSDHTAGIVAGVVAAAMGVPLIEKHFTLDKDLPGPDHPMSMDPSQMKALCDKARDVSVKRVDEKGLIKTLKKVGINIRKKDLEIILGRGDRNLSMLEKKQRVWARKSLVAGCSIDKGEMFSQNNLAIKRPEGGIYPKEQEEVFGRKAKCFIEEGTPITWSMVI